MRFQKYRSKEHLCVYCFEAESKLKHKEKNFCGGFLLKPKTHFFEGPKWYFLKINFQICISAFVLLCKRKLHAHFHQKILIFGPPRIFSKWKLWRACDGRLQNFEIILLKSYLTFGYLTRSVRSKKNSTFHPTVHTFGLCKTISIQSSILQENVQVKL